MIFLVHLFSALIFYSLSNEINGHILVIAPPYLSHILPSWELAKQLSFYNHVTFLISASRIRELEHKGLLTNVSNSNTLDIVGLIDGNDEAIEINFQDSQVNLNNIKKIDSDDKQMNIAVAEIMRMGVVLNQLFRSNISTCVASLIQTCSSNWSPLESLLTRPISRPINMIIARSFTPLPLFDISVPVHIFLPSNLRGVVKYLHKINSDTKGQKEIFHYFQNNIPHAAGFICNSWKELEGKYVNKFQQLSGNYAPIRFVGPIILENKESSESRALEMTNWLNKQSVATVIYIAFGSFIQIPPSMIDTLAFTLSQYSFIWSLKTKASFPSSLSNLNSNHQLILDWVPQRTVLAHPSVSLFISHGGWNSLVEGMIYGKPLLVWPFIADQFDNAQQVVELGMARQVSNNLQADIEHMLKNDSYIKKAKEIQQMLNKVRSSDAKEQIADIAQLISSGKQTYFEL